MCVLYIFRNRLDATPTTPLDRVTRTFDYKRDETIKEMNKKRGTETCTCGETLEIPCMVVNSRKHDHIISTVSLFAHERALVDDHARYLL